MKTLKLAGAAIILFGGLMTSSNAETFTIRIGAGHPGGALWVKTLEDFYVPRVNERIKQETDSEVEFDLEWGASLCKLGECFEAAEIGLVDMAMVMNAFEPTKLMANNFTMYVPFGAPDPRVVMKATQQAYDNTPFLTKTMDERYNQKLVGVGVVSNYGMITTFDWDTFNDLKGHKITAAGPNLTWLPEGVTGVQGTLNEWFNGLQTGIYEGAIMFPNAILSFKLNEVSKQYTKTDFGSQHTPVFTFNKDAFAGLPEDVRKIILETGREWGTHMAQVTNDLHDKSFEKLKEYGLRVDVANAETKKAWANALSNVPKVRYERVEQEVPGGGEIIYKYIDALKQAGHKFPRDWAAER